MTRGPAPIVYIRLRKRVKIAQGTPIYLGQVAQILVEPEYESIIKKLTLYEPNAQDGNLILVDMMLITKKLKEKIPSIQVELYGPPHGLIEISAQSRKPNLLFITLVWVLLFIGSGLAIMNFHADVSMLQVHQRIYELVTGKKSLHPYMIQIPYSIGIGLGMVIFFNHVFKKKFNEEPSPLEVEMFLYEENLNQYVITEEYDKLHRERDST